MIRIIIAGSRTFEDYDLLEESVLDEFVDEIRECADFEIVSGTAKGADRLGEEFAKAKGWNVKRFPADWNKYGKSAGYIRNKEMAEYADALVAFWDEKSRGTKHMIDLAKENGLRIKVVTFKP